MTWITPGTVVAGSVLTATRYNNEIVGNLNSLARGLIAYESNNTQTSLSTAVADITNLSVTFNTEADHNYLVISCVTGIIKQTNAGTVFFTITDGSNNQVSAWYEQFAVDQTVSKAWIIDWIINPGVTTPTRKVRQLSSSAGGLFNRGDVGDNQTFLAVLDLGNNAV
jgi:hypothetical protein